MAKLKHLSAQKILAPRKLARSAAAIGIFWLALTTSSCQNKPDQPAALDESKTPSAQSYNLATVDYEELSALHPDMEKLDEIDKSIALKQQQAAELQGKAIEKLRAEGSSKMRSAVESAKAKLEGERATIEGEMAALSRNMSAQIEGELKIIQSQLQANLEQEVKAYKTSHGVAEVAPKATSEKIPPNIDGQVSDYLQNLSMVRERNLAAKRLELEKQVSEEINAKRNEVDIQLADYEAGVAAQYQNERLNLQLTAQNSTDEAAKTAAEERLSAISLDIDSKRKAKRKELEAGYSSLRAEKTSAMQSELEAYQNKLNSEVAQKVEKKRQELGFAAPAAPAHPSQESPGKPPPEIQAKINEMQARMEGELASRKAELSAKMQAKSEEARQRLQEKQSLVEAELKAVEDQIAAEIAKQIQKMAPEANKTIEKTRKEIEALQEQRKTLAQKIADDISHSVEGVAKRKEIDMVIGVVPKFEYSAYPDLTELSKVAVQTENSK